MKTNSWVRLLAAVTLVAPTVAAVAMDDLLGGGRGGGGGKSNGGGNNSGGNSGGGKSNGGGNNSGGSQGGGKSNGGGNNNSGGGGQLGGGRGNSGGGGSTTPPPNRDRDNGGNRDVITVPDRGNTRPQQVQGRSGQSNYRTNNNGATRGGNSREYIQVQDIPSYNSDIRRQASREENVRVNRGNSYGNDYRWRTGYYHYNPQWNDNNFFYPHYSFNIGNNCALSPWYSYSYLPGYINHARISFDNHWNLRVDLNFNYRWSNKSRYDRRSDSYDIDMAIASIDRAFDRDDPRLIGELIPRRDRVTIRSRWERAYSIGSDDFYDLMADLIENSRTKSYNIQSVRHDRNRSTVRVMAEHVYWDAWRNQRSSFHSYTLEEGRYGEYQIVEFGINDRGFNDWDDRRDDNDDWD